MRLTASAATELTSSRREAESSVSKRQLPSLNPADMISQYKNASLEFGSGGTTSNKHTTNTPHVDQLRSPTTFGEASQIDLSQGAVRLARELDEFIAKGLESPPDADAFSTAPPSATSVADLQLQTARKLRKLLPTNRELLYMVQERNWIPLLLGWLNLHDRPAVQVEALLALTNIAELCAQQSYYSPPQSSTGAAAAAQAAAAAVKFAGSSMASTSGPGPGMSPFYPFPSGPDSSLPNNNGYPYASMISQTQGSVPFPPLSFSHTLSPEALAAFDASLSSTLQQSKVRSAPKVSKSDGLQASPPMSSVPPLGLPSFSPNSLHHPLPSSTLSSSANLSSMSSALSSQGGSGSLSNSFLPPPTPVLNQSADSTFPQQLSASSQHLLLRHADAIPTLISLLTSPNKEVYEQAMWILGSIAAGDSTGTGSSGNGSSVSSSEGSREKSVAARDVILAAGVMNQLLRCLDTHPSNLSLQRIGSWTLSNLVEGIFQQPSHGKSGPKTSEYSSCDEIDIGALLPVLRRLLRMGDVEVLSYTCWTLSHLCDGPSSHISAVVSTGDPRVQRGGLVPRLVELLGHSSWRVTKPALRTIGNIVCAESDDNGHGSSPPTDYTEIILECHAVPKLKELVTHCNREIQKEACWTLSNIAAGTVDQIQAVIDSGAIVPLVKLVSETSTDQEVRSEACWVVLNATSCGSDSQIEVLVDEGCVSVLGVLLGEASMVMMALEGLERVLQVEEAREIARREQGDDDDDDDETKNPTLVSASLIERALEKHNSSAVNKRAKRIWNQHFVLCALCNKSYSKHRTLDATFCDECKCYVCANCDCTIYHLSYQEELWAESEEKTEAKKNAKKNKKAKKKQKQKQKKAEQQNTPEGKETNSNSSEEEHPSMGNNNNNTNNSKEDPRRQDEPLERKKAKSKESSNPTMGFESPVSEVADSQQPPVDFVLYLQQTGSIIALAKLMDSLEYADGNLGDDFLEKESQLFRPKVLKNQEAN